MKIKMPKAMSGSRTRLMSMAAAIALVAVSAFLAIQQAAAQDANAPPAISSATIHGNTLDAFYDRDLDGDYVPPLGAYVIRINGGKTDVTEVAVSGRKVTLTLAASAENSDDDVKLTYRHRAQPTLRSTAGVHAETIRNYQVSVLIAEVVEPTPTPTPRAASQVSGQAADDFIPTNFRLTVRNNQIWFEWDAPDSGTVREYQFRWANGTDPTSGTVVTVAADAQRRQQLGSRGQTVSGQVRARDDSDGSYGPYTHVLYATPKREGDRQAPATTTPALTPSDGQLTVTWTAPADYGYSIHRYSVRYRDVGDTNWSTVNNAWRIGVDDARSYTIENARNGTAVEVQVRSDSYGGRSAWSDSATGTPAASTQPQPTPTPVPATDPTATIAAGTSPITEGANAVFTVTLNPAPSSNVTVNYGITVSGNYGVSAATNQTVTVGTGGSGTITLSTTDDSVDEANGSVTVTLATGTGYSVGTANSASVTVNDNDDPTATVAANSASITEGSDAVFTVTLSRAQTSNVSVKYNVTVSGNYGVAAANNQTVAISSGNTTGTITLSTTDDSVDEANGSVTVTLAAGTGYAVGTANSASVTVNDDDEPTATSADAIPATWSLVPAGLVGNQFRLLFVTSGTRNAATTSIGDYNTFVQNAANADGVDAILKGFHGDFKAVGCTDTVNATANTATTGTGVPIYWVGGAKVADNYADLYDGSWDSNQPRNQKGETFSGGVNNPRVWTGCENDGTKAASPDGYSRALGGTYNPAPDVASGRPKEQGREIRRFNAGKDTEYPLYGLSPVLTLVDIDYDTDDDGLIEVNSLAQLNAIRYDPDGDALVGDNINTVDIDEGAAYATAFPTPAAGMGCQLVDHDGDRNTPDAPVCKGYELTANLDFDTNNSGGANDGDTYWNGGAGWEPIGNSPRFTATFDGNGNTIANLFINRRSSDDMGLFGRVENTTIRNLTLTGASVTGDDYVSLLAGRTYGSTAIRGVSVSGSVTAGDDRAGLLAGRIEGSTSISNASASGSITGDSRIGLLVGQTDGSATISGAFASGSVTSRRASAGGLVGLQDGSTHITASYSAGSVTGVRSVGGLVGDQDAGTHITASYSSASVTGSSEDIGGLVGLLGGTVTASYSTGAVGGTGTSKGGLAGSGGSTVTDSYWDTESSGQATSAGGTGKTGAELRAPTGYTGIYANWNLDLDNADGDNSHATGQDNPWDFGENYNYPTLRNTGGKQKGPGPVGNLAVALNAGNLVVTWTAPTETGDGTLTGNYAGRYSADGGSTWTAIASQSAATYTITSPQADTAYQIEVWAIGEGAAHTRGGPASVTYTPVVLTDYDSDDDGLIEVDSLAKLDAIRYDMNGDGTVSTGDQAAYAAAFPNAASGMGCPASGCTGYELTADLDFDENDDDSITAADAAYWNGGEGWRPIGGLENARFSTGFNATFEGNNNTISNLFINRRWETTDEWAGYRVGLFGLATQNSVIKDLTLANVSVTGDEEVGGTASHIGGLVGAVTGGAVRHSSASGTVSTTGSIASKVGGLAGSNTGIIYASYANNNVTANGSYWVGGLVGQNGGPYAKGSGTIVASYSQGDVSGRGDVGGLVGENYATILISYSTGAVNKHGGQYAVAGGLVGRQSLNNNDRTVYYSVTNSYWSTTDTSWNFGVGSDDRNNNNTADSGETNTVHGFPTSDLQAPTGYNGLYANWNSYDRDGNAGTAQPWCFGSSSQLPWLKPAGGTCSP